MGSARSASACLRRSRAAVGPCHSTESALSAASAMVSALTVWIGADTAALIA